MIPKVYILDDDLVHAKLVAANLGPGRFRTRVFDRPDELLAHHAEEPADAVITDLVMPDVNGVEVTRRCPAPDRAPARREGQRQEPRGPGDPLLEPPLPGAVRGDQLLGPSRQPARGRTVRIQEGRLHRCAGGQAWAD